MKDAIVSALAAEDSPLRREGVQAILDFVLDQPLGELVDFDETKRLVIEALTEKNLALIFERHIKPGWQRYDAAVKKSDDTVGALVPDEARRDIRDAITKSKLPKGKWTKGAVDPSLFRKLFAPVFANMLVSFAKRLPLPGSGVAAEAATSTGGRDGGGLTGRLTRGVQKRAVRLVDASRSVMGGLGAEMERRVQAAAREFSEGAMNVWRDSLRERLRSGEGRELLTQISQQITDHVMMTKIAEIHEDADRLPIEPILDVVPKVIPQAARQAFVQRIVDQEVSAFLEAEGERTLEELLSELGMLDEVRRATVSRVDALTRKLVTTNAFGDWLEKVLAAGTPD